MSHKIKVLIPGPIKFNFIKEGLEYYSKKIKPFIDLEIIAPKVKTEKLNKKLRLQKEEEILKKYISKKDYLIILDEKGKIFKSQELAKYLKNLIENFSQIAFVIGGPDGISENFKKEAKELLSLSKFTLNHEIALLVLLEAIYRSFTIIKGIPYHRE
ncbi:23S rRNA (pseudouridine(1915)-N(3))-methyltransferase RlmH [Thermodesulfobacterium hydrogeniphilum]|uniref:23S rRNA (pseudouridine(1915)-N(3))-methyltransferase RlmH n=1 Tax=Thermodesulfobacterium hydrogeniphilum TaxID=161156 RepID=UPI0005707C97|nr:23S rRNA (pseudouridine(1915)-N(3))-methyltransferase RlmH [Thermodesulfobacterium hydrogeniphilum]